jgi:HSP20 family protein
MPLAIQTTNFEEAIMAGTHLPTFFNRDRLPTFFGRERDGLGSLFDEIERSFDEFARRAPLAGMSAFGNGMRMPRIDIAEGKEGIDIAAELPGVDEKDIDVTLADDRLTIRGEKRSERSESEKGKNWQLAERNFGSFSRTIELPYDVESDKVQAKFDKGVLHIHVPKPAEIARKEKKIEIRKG